MAKAKVNLFLDVLYKRTDGYHEIRSIVTEIDLADNIIFKLTDNNKIEIACSSKLIPESDNLVYKIACYLKDIYKIDKGLNIILEKNIPLSAGLGGGSSNAAQTIKMCNKLWDLHLTNLEMNELANLFGSDINFFLKGNMASISGRGEIVNLINPNITINYLLLVNPGIKISSKDAYSWVQSENVPEVERLQNVRFALKSDDLKLLCENMYNTLEIGVFKHYPEIKRIKNKLLKFNALGSLMSGSGSTVFAIFNNRKEMVMAYNYFKDLDYWSHITKIQN